MGGAPGVPTSKITLCGLMTALMAICSQIAIPLPLIPINLALIAVYLSGLLLGSRWGTVALLVYLLLGGVGAPVFAGFSGGLGRLVGPTGGYLVGYVAAAFLTGWLRERWGWGFGRLCLAMTMGLTVCYGFGTLWFVALTGKTLAAALGACVLPFLPGDAVKILVVGWLVNKLPSRMRSL